MTGLEDFFNHANGEISRVGSKLLRMDVKDSVLAELSLSTTERLSRVEDAELTSAITDLKTMEVAYQAALTASSRVLQLSLVNFV
jgi:flagellar hook-associated protein 3 FlgL